MNTGAAAPPVVVATGALLAAAPDVQPGAYVRALGEPRKLAIGLMVLAFALTEGAAKTGVTPAALGSGYVTFFLYSTVIGVAAIVLAFVVAARQRSLDQAVRQTT